MPALNAPACGNPERISAEGPRTARPPTVESLGTHVYWLRASPQNSISVPTIILRGPRCPFARLRPTPWSTASYRMPRLCSTPRTRLHSSVREPLCRAFQATLINLGRLRIEPAHCSHARRSTAEPMSVKIASRTWGGSSGQACPMWPIASVGLSASFAVPSPRTNSTQLFFDMQNGMRVHPRIQPN